MICYALFCLCLICYCIYFAIIFVDVVFDVATSWLPKKFSLSLLNSGLTLCVFYGMLGHWNIACVTFKSVC